MPRMGQPSVCGCVSDCDARLGLNAFAYPSASTSYVNSICICVHCGKKMISFAITIRFNFAQFSVFLLCFCVAHLLRRSIYPLSRAIENSIWIYLQKCLCLIQQSNKLNVARCQVAPQPLRVHRAPFGLILFIHLFPWLIDENVQFTALSPSPILPHLC